MTDLSDITGKSSSTLYGHLAYLRDRGVLVYAPAGDRKLKITFTVPGDNSRILEMVDSENLELPLNISSLNKDIDLKEERDLSEFQNSGKKPIARKVSRADPRSFSPAIQCVKGLTSRFPPKELYDDIIRVLGEKPNRETLEACRKEWVKRGYNPFGWGWLLDWYSGGIPQRNGRLPRSSSPPANPQGAMTLEQRAKITGENLDDLKKAQVEF